DRIREKETTWAPLRESGGEAWFAAQRRSGVAEPAQVSVLRLENICAFERLDLEFSKVPGSGQWMIALGDNGVGKSTVLRALALAAIEPTTATSLLELRSSSAPLLRGGTDSGGIGLEFATGTVEVRIGKLSSGVETMLESKHNGAIRPPIFAYGCQRGTGRPRVEKEEQWR
ncbi:MAG: hypothetical protein GY856_35635, partial [bacterium]|nr:hypothetical protein [bacterium]